ncbi:MAG: hypothetical protein J07HX5_02009, partial [halophilic archaeon J07HX5]
MSTDGGSGGATATPDSRAVTVQPGGRCLLGAVIIPVEPNGRSCAAGTEGNDTLMWIAPVLSVLCLPVEIRATTTPRASVNPTPSGTLSFNSSRTTAVGSQPLDRLSTRL